MKKTWSDGHRVAYLNCCEGLWILITEKASDNGGQVVKVVNSFPQDIIQLYWNEGKRIHTLCNDGLRSWIIIAENCKSGDKPNQYWTFSTVIPERTIQDAWKEKKHVHTLCWSNYEDRFILIFEKRSGFLFEPKINISNDFPLKYVKDLGHQIKWKKR